jgi:hypothetical protein
MTGALSIQLLPWQIAHGMAWHESEVAASFVQQSC